MRSFAVAVAALVSVVAAQLDAASASQAVYSGST